MCHIRRPTRQDHSLRHVARGSDLNQKRYLLRVLAKGFLQYPQKEASEVPGSGPATENAQGVPHVKPLRLKYTNQAVFDHGTFERDRKGRDLTL